MRTILEKSRYLVLLAVCSSLVASAATFAWGTWKTILAVNRLLRVKEDDTHVLISLIELMDKFLIAVGLYIFAVGLYELFIADLDLPEWLTIRNLHEIKSRLSSVIILVMAVVFLERLLLWGDPRGTLLYGIAVTVVTGGLIAFSQLGAKD